MPVFPELPYEQRTLLIAIDVGHHTEYTILELEESTILVGHCEPPELFYTVFLVRCEADSVERLVASRVQGPIRPFTVRSSDLVILCG